MIKTLMGSIRDYMKVTVATPLLVLGEVLCEMLIPFITANLIVFNDTATTEIYTLSLHDALPICRL